MSSVFSKLIDRASARYDIRQETLTRGLVGGAVALYALKLGYPYLAGSIKRQLLRQRQQQQQQKRSQRSGQVNKRDDKNGVARGTNKDDEDEQNALLAGDTAGSADRANSKKALVGLDRDFLRQLLMLLRIMVPGWRSREAGLLACATLILLARTFLSVYVAELEGQIVKRIVLRDVRGFSHMLARWFAIALPATFVNSAIRYLEGRLALSFRYDFFSGYTVGTWCTFVLGCVRWLLPSSLLFLRFFFFIVSCCLVFSSIYLLFLGLTSLFFFLSFPPFFVMKYKYLFVCNCSSCLRKRKCILGLEKRRNTSSFRTLLFREEMKRMKDGRREEEGCGMYNFESVRLCSHDFSIQRETSDIFGAESQ